MFNFFKKKPEIQTEEPVKVPDNTPKLTQDGKIIVKRVLKDINFKGNVITLTDTENDTYTVNLENYDKTTIFVCTVDSQYSDHKYNTVVIREEHSVTFISTDSKASYYKSFCKMKNYMETDHKLLTVSQAENLLYNLQSLYEYEEVVNEYRKDRSGFSLTFPLTNDSNNGFIEFSLRDSYPWGLGFKLLHKYGKNYQQLLLPIEYEMTYLLGEESEVDMNTKLNNLLGE